MPVTIIPAKDQSGANAGWEMLARGIQLGQARKHARETAYQDLIIKLSDPGTTEDQQNAILTQDPKQFQASYGVPLEQVGKDIARFRKSAADITAPNGMVMQGQEFAGNRRVLVEHPAGTAQEQQQRATLESTYAGTAAETQRAAANKTQAELNVGEEQRKVVGFIAGIKSTMRTPDGKVPTFNQVQEYIKGNFDLTPTTKAQEKLEAIREILGVDQSTPEGRIAIHDFATSQNLNDEQLRIAVANTRNINADAALREQELEFLKQGLGRDGRPLPGGTDPKDIVQVGKGFTDAFNGALGALGFPTKATTTNASWADAWRSLDFFNSKTAIDNPKLLPAIFGNGLADPAAVRRDLLAAIPAGRKLVTIDFPSFDAKTNMPTTTKLTIDQAVPVVTQMRRTFAVTMPPVFAALRQASPQSLLYMVASNPLLEQMAKAYAPDIADMIAKARETEAAAPTQPDANAPPEDENLAPLTGDIQTIQKEVDDLKLMLQGKAGVTPAGQ